MQSRSKQKPDQTLVKDQLQALQHILNAFGMRYFLQSMIWILTKEPTEFVGVEISRLIPFVFNPIQNHLYANLAKMNRVLKARQAGLTTFFTLVRLFVPIITQGGVTGLLTSQSSKYAAIQFNMVRRAHRLIGAEDPGDPSANDLCTSLKANLLHTTYSNRMRGCIRSTGFQTDCGIGGSGRSRTEYDIATCGVFGSSTLAQESRRDDIQHQGRTGERRHVRRGDDRERDAGGYFCEQYLATLNNPARADADPHFYSWYWSPEYCDYDLTEKEKDELIADLTADEIRLIAQIHKELSEIAFVKAA